jgi:flagellar L-ring protein precursor FlgH
MRLLAAFALLPLAACSVISSGAEAARTPQFTPVAYPAPVLAHSQVIAMSVSAPPPSAANSLWRSGARAFFKDQRAGRIGDILTVNIDIDDSASVSNATSRNRSNEISAGVSNFLGLESSLGRILPGGFDPKKAVGFGGESASSGNGAINRSEAIRLTIAAVVTQVLPNGNLVIQGRQEVRTNGELRELTVAGIVRPEDITAANTVRHEQIAEARISYGGRGDLTRVQRTPAGQAVVEAVTPF